MNNGTYTTAELIDSLVLDLNNMVKNFMSGQCIAACGIVNAMGQKLVNLKTGVEADLKSKNDEIEALKECIRELGGECKTVPIKEFLEDVNKAL